jgi:hypothetical protein
MVFTFALGMVALSLFSACGSGKGLTVRPVTSNESEESEEQDETPIDNLSQYGNPLVNQNTTLTTTTNTTAAATASSSPSPSPSSAPNPSPSAVPEAISLRANGLVSDFEVSSGTDVVVTLETTGMSICETRFVTPDNNISLSNALQISGAAGSSQVKVKILANSQVLTRCFTAAGLSYMTDIAIDVIVPAASPSPTSSPAASPVASPAASSVAPSFQLLVNNVMGPLKVAYGTKVDITLSTTGMSSCEVRLVSTVASELLSTALQITSGTLTPAIIGKHSVIATCRTALAGFSSSVEVESPIVPEFHLLFVSSEKFLGDMDGVAGANAHCVRMAKAANNGQGIRPERPWKALLSTGAQTLDGLITSTKPVKNVMGGDIVTSATHLVDTNYTNMKLPVSYTEKLAAISSTSNVWSGTAASGASSGSDCSDWKSSSAYLHGYAGSSNAINATWIYATNPACNTYRRIYCMSF